MTKKEEVNVYNEIVKDAISIGIGLVGTGHKAISDSKLLVNFDLGDINQEMAELLKELEITKHELDSEKDVKGRLEKGITFLSLLHAIIQKAEKLRDEASVEANKEARAERLYKAIIDSVNAGDDLPKEFFKGKETELEQYIGKMSLKFGK